MKITVLSDCRLPTLPTGGHGLGRLVFDIATTLKKRGHDVELWASEGSQFDGKLVVHDNEADRAKNAVLDAETIYLDCSHFHDLSKAHPDAKIFNWIMDGECKWTPPNILVSTAYDKQYYPDATIIPAGIDIDRIPFFADVERYLVFAAKIHKNKGFLDALLVHQMQSIPVKFVGKRFTDMPLPDYRDTLHGAEFHNFVGKATGLIHPLCEPSALGGGLMPLEAAAMGVPSIVYDTVSPAYHVEHCVSGYVVKDCDEMVDAIPDLQLLDRKKAREWVAETHNLNIMADALEKVFSNV